jgi:hypothetical protein
MAVDTFADWRPFLLAARAARLEEVHWALDPLDFRLIGQVRRAKRGPLWTYLHVRTGGDLNVDEEGVPHRVRLDRAMRIRTKPADIHAAVWWTGVPQEELDRLPEASFDDPWGGDGDDDASVLAQAAGIEPQPPPASSPVRRERHLRLVRDPPALR